MSEPRPVPPEQLYPRRLAWRALGIVLDQYALRAMTLKLNPDDPTQCLPGVAQGELSFFEDYAEGRGIVIATVLLDGTMARVLVERIERLVRRNHRRDFRADEFGIYHRPGAYDVDINVDLAEVMEIEGELLRTGKQRVLAPGHQTYRPPHVTRAFGGIR
jgi:hypothetical protein